jgi:hypothetical protein
MEHSLKSFHILIVGAGELGSRHLQGLLKVNFPAFIDVLDTNYESLERCKQRENEVKRSPLILGITYHIEHKSIAKAYDLCIIATTSNVRLAVIKSLVDVAIFRFFLLEKVLFQKPIDFEEALKIFQDNNIKAWINCPRRTYKLYNDIKSKINNEIVTISILGGEWGLACNAIHYIDLFSFLTDSKDFSYDLSGVTQIINSKRSGFYEFGGTISIRNSNSSELILHSRIGNRSQSLINIITDSNSWIIDEARCELMEFECINNWELTRKTYETIYQSNLTNIISEEILIKGYSSLPEYTVNECIHKEMIIEFTKVFIRNNFEYSNGCPIT